jgi:hypothetical protein
MDRITNLQTRVSHQVRPVDRLTASRPPTSDSDEKRLRTPYGVVDRVTLSPEGRAMAMQQRAALSVRPAEQILTYGPGMPPAAHALRLPYTPED